MNYKGQRITKNLFTRGKDEKQDNGNKSSINEKQKDIPNTHEDKPRDKERNIKEKLIESKRTNKKRDKNMEKNKDNYDTEEWYYHACCKNEKLAMQQCSNYNKWFHEECVGLTISDIEFVSPIIKYLR
ncbi:hypothetical protein HHI36_018716, partial [Cryptolaemus montrouzieri]